MPRKIEAEHGSLRPRGPERSPAHRAGDQRVRAAPKADRALRCRSQYCSIRFTEHLDLEAIQPSIGSVGDTFDNGLMETIIGLLKTECGRTTVFHGGPYRTIADVEHATAGWVDWSRPAAAAQ